MQDTTTRTTWAIGDKVRIHPGARFPAGVDRGVTYTIKDVPRGARGVNYVARTETGVGVRAPGDAFVAADSDDVAASDLPSTTMTFPPRIEPGMVVTGVRSFGDAPGVVLRVNGDGETCSAVWVGGENGRYWRGVPTRTLEVVPADRIKIVPAD